MNTPTALPPGTFLQLGEKFNASLTLETANKITSITTIGTGAYGCNPKRKIENGVRYPYWEVAIHGAGIIRSHHLPTRRAARDLQREVTRKIAIFIFTNRVKGL